MSLTDLAENVSLAESTIEQHPQIASDILHEPTTSHTKQPVTNSQDFSDEKKLQPLHDSSFHLPRSAASTSLSDDGKLLP